MKIIIVGGGKVGETLVADLSREGHDITVIDRHDNVVEQICDRYDVMGLSGNACLSACSRARPVIARPSPGYIIRSITGR